MSRADKQKTAAACAFLRSYLKKHGRKPRNDVFEAAVKAGINKHTLEVASREIAVSKSKGTHPELGQCNYWCLARSDSTEPARHKPSGDRLREEFHLGYRLGTEAVAYEIRSALAALRMSDTHRAQLGDRINKAIERARKSARYRAESK
ncbi:MAG: hypothetical protein EPN57_08605 [Paraburkholderia sp.]|nr:MAG: hypothetical protein EPN57_08605 [Paraburkholderia sp.]